MSTLTIKAIVETFKVNCECIVCGSTNDLTVDHIYPKSKKGANNLFNYQIMCTKHNNNKSNYIDYSHNYVEVVSMPELIAAYYTQRNKLPLTKRYSRNYIRLVLENFLGKAVNVNSTTILLSDYVKLTEILKLYGIKFPASVKSRYIPESRIPYLTKLQYNFVLPMPYMQQWVEKNI